MKKPSVLLNTGIKTTLFVSLVLLGASALAQTETILEKTLEANYQFLYDYNVNTTHGFSNSIPSAAAPNRQYLLALDVIEDDAGCLAAQEQLSLRDCLTAVYHTRLVNDYTLGRLR